MGAAPYMNIESEKNAEQRGGLDGIQAHELGEVSLMYTPQHTGDKVSPEWAPGKDKTEGRLV